MRSERSRIRGWLPEFWKRASIDPAKDAEVRLSRRAGARG
jgi:hypothetical protein